jgi:hypothetical protein
MRRQRKLLRPKWTPPRAAEIDPGRFARFLRSIRKSGIPKARPEKFDRSQEAERRRRQIAKGVLKVTP